MAWLEPQVPQRSHISLACLIFIGLWVGIGKVLLYFVDGNFAVRPLTSSTFLLFALAIIISIVLFTLKKTRTPARCVAIGLLAGVGIGFFAISSAQTTADSLAGYGSRTVTIQALADVAHTKFGMTQKVKIVRGGPRNTLVQISYAQGVVPLLLGQIATTTCIIKPLIPSETNRFLRTQNIWYNATVSFLTEIRYQRGVLGMIYRYREKISNQLIRQGSSSAITAGILLGDRTQIKKRELSETFARAGLSHMLAVSGTHLALLAGMILAIANACSFKRSATQVVVLIVCLGYVILTGLSPSALRAWGMLAVLSTSIWMFRRSDSLNALALTGITCLLLCPWWALSLSFQLSVAAVAGIIIFASYGGWLLQCAMPRLPSSIRSGIAMSFMALIFTFPLSALSFGQVSIASPFSNLLCAPLFTISLALGLLGAIFTLFSPTLAVLPFSFSCSINRVIETIAQYFADSSWAVVEIQGSAYIFVMVLVSAIVFWIWWPQMSVKRVRVFLIVLIACVLTAAALVVVTPYFHAPSREVARVVVLDIGQGDATLIQSKGKTVLVDAGPSKTKLSDKLREFGVTEIDAVMFTHDHEDHIGGAEALQPYSVDTIYVAQGASLSEKYQDISGALNAPIREVVEADLLTVGDIEIDIIGPVSPVADPSSNQSCIIGSIALKAGANVENDPEMDVEGDSVLFCGDAESATLEGYARDPALDVDIFKVGHHGSKIALSQEVLNLTSPNAGIISVGANNSYGHPTQQVLTYLREYGTRVFRTDVDSDIVIGFN